MDIQTLRDKNEKYDLQIKLKDSAITIRLLVLQSPRKLYVKLIDRDNIPPQLSFLLDDVHLIFEYFKFPYEVFIREGAIKIKVKFSFKKKQIIKQAIIHLDEQHLFEQQILQLRIQNIFESIEQLKQEKGKQNADLRLDSQLKIQQQNIEDVVVKQLQGTIAHLRQQIYLANISLNDNLEYSKKILKQVIEIGNSNFAILAQTRKTMDNFFQTYNKLYQEEQQKLNSNNKPPQKRQQKKKQVKYGNIRIINREETNENQQQLKPIIKIPISPFVIKQLNSQKAIEQISAFEKPGGAMFIIQNNVIKHIGISNQNNQIILRKKLKLRGKKQFKVRIVKTLERCIYIGVVNKVYSRFKKTNFAICYFGYDGEIWDDKPIQTKGKGFNLGDVVEVQIGVGRISWKVNGKLEARHLTQKLNDEKFIFFPFIEMASHGDSVQWIG